MRIRLGIGAVLVALPLASGAEARRDSSASGRPRVDLLRPIDPNKDTIRGLSTLEGKVLLLGTNSQVQIPYEAPEAYDLTFVLQRLDLQGKLVVGLASGEHQFDVVLDNFHDGEHRSGLHNLDGRHVVDRDRDVRTGALLNNDAPMTLVYSVRPGKVRVTLDRKEVFSWEGEFKRLAVDARFRVPNRRAFFFGNAISRFRVTRIELVCVTGRGRPTR